MEYKKHFFVIDTSSLLFDPSSLGYFKGNTLIIPVSVIQELDKHKDRPDQVGNHARLINRHLHALKKLGRLDKGVLDPETSVTIKIMHEDPADVPTSLDKNSADDRILSVCFTLIKDKKKANKVHLVTNDINLSLKAAAYSIDSFEFEPEDFYSTSDYLGYSLLEESIDLNIDDIYKQKGTILPKDIKLEENECVLIKNPNNKKSVRCIHKSGLLRLIEPKLRCCNITPLNNEQAFAMHILLDPSIKLITLTGTAGTGKSIVTAAAGLSQTIEPRSAIYERIMISRSLVLLSGKDKLGFLKGSLKEKLDPYILPLKDAIDQAIGEKSGGFEYLTLSSTDMETNQTRKPKIEIEPLQYIRGRSLRKAFFIVDEAQNLTLSEIKTIVSRIGEDSKIVLLGDLDQIDNAYLSRQNNGLAQVIERFKGSKIAAHITLEEGVRSELASEAAERL